jgi:hypothetical protein
VVFIRAEYTYGYALEAPPQANEAIYGWTGGNMAALYTRTADRTRLAREAISMLEKPEKGTSIPELSLKVRTSEPKSQ